MMKGHIDLMCYWKVHNVVEGELLKAGNELEGSIDFIKLSRNFVLFKSPLVTLKMSPLKVVAGDPLPLHSFIKNVCVAHVVKCQYEAQKGYKLSNSFLFVV